MTGILKENIEASLIAKEAELDQTSVTAASEKQVEAIVIEDSLSIDNSGTKLLNESSNTITTTNCHDRSDLIAEAYKENWTLP